MSQAVPVVDDVEVEAAADLLVRVGEADTGLFTESEVAAPPLDVAREAPKCNGEERVRLRGIGSAEDGVAP
jgi:hypothetical protein